MKTYSTSVDLVQLLKSRGLEISDEQQAEHYLKNIGYYRLSAYMHPLLEIPKYQHQYKPGSTFATVLRLYRFDKKLRVLLFNEIEKIEIAVREAVMNITAEFSGDNFWLTNPAHFVDRKCFSDTIALIDHEYSNSTEDFIRHFKNTYIEPYPPAWILGELLTMGAVNRVYRNMKEDKIKKKHGLFRAKKIRKDCHVVFEDYLLTLGKISRDEETADIYRIGTGACDWCCCAGYQSGSSGE